ncbi:MAG: sulfatase-like hydrolase/transferase [Planctomycetota bacterium]
MIRRLALLLAAIAFAACGGPDPAPARSDRPHVVVIVADDLGWADVGYHGGTIATPAINRLAAEGRRLERFYACPMCSPSRAQVLTGRSAVRHGILRNLKPQTDRGLPLGEPTLADRLRAAGYATTLVGKWHLGHGTDAQGPHARGFDRTYGHLRGWIDYANHECDGIPDWYRDGQPLDEPGYATTLLADEAVRVLEQHDPETPLFLYLAFNAPHPPLHAAPGIPPDAPGAAGFYRSMVRALDDGVGRVVDAIDRAGLRDDCVLVFLSDNGGSLKFGGRNDPLAGGKYSVSEGGLRVPAIVSWPGVVAPGSDVAFTSTLDLAPTLAAAAGKPMPPTETDGVDMLPVWTGAVPTSDHPIVVSVEHAKRRKSALLEAPYKLVHETPTGGGTPTVSLFDVVADPEERSDLSGSEPDRVQAMEERLRRTLDDWGG